MKKLAALIVSEIFLETEECHVETDKIRNSTIVYNICYNDKIGVPHIVFNNINCYFLKNGDYSSLIFCDNIRNKNIINIYFKIIKQRRYEVFSLIDEFKDDDDFIFGNDNFTIFRLIKDNSH